MNFSLQISAILLLFKNPSRMAMNLQTQLQIYESIFGEKMWDNAMTAITFWGHSKQSRRDRRRKCRVDPNCDHKASTAEERL